MKRTAVVFLGLLISSPCCILAEGSLRGLAVSDVDATTQTTQAYEEGKFVANSRKTCKNSLDCPQVQCFAPSGCPINICQNDGYCSLVIPSVEENNNYYGQDETEDIMVGGGGGGLAAGGGEPCGNATCSTSQICCSEACSLCSDDGGNCTDIFCGPEDDTHPDEDEEGEECNQVTCGKDEFCCNHSCSLCAALEGGFCNKQFCDSDIAVEENEEVEMTVPEEGFLFVSRGDCECEERCARCQKVFGICVQLYCFNGST